MAREQMEIFDYLSKNDALEFVEEYGGIEDCVYTQMPKVTKYLIVKAYTKKSKNSHLRIKLALIDHDAKHGIPFQQ
jgi:Ser/Thr protein kinase RdoA (MazF antagonist)